MIIPMKKASIVVLKEDYDKVITSLQKNEVIMIINNDSDNYEKKIDEEINENLYNKVEKAITFSKKYEEKGPLFGKYREIDYSKFSQINQKTINDIKDLEELQNSITELEQKKKDLKDKKDTYLPWVQVPFSISEIDKLKYSKFSMGYIQAAKLNKFIEVMTNGGYIYETLSLVHGQIPVYFVYFNNDEEQVLNEVKSLEYNEIKFVKTTKTFSTIVEEYDSEIKLIDEEISRNNKKVLELSKNIEDYRLLSDQVLNVEEKNNVKYLNTLETSVIIGWVRSDELDKLNESVSSVTEFYDIETTDPTPEDKAPTYTKNNKVVSQFEGITDMFSKPMSTEADPNPVMSIWYWILFGMMVGDIGYGIVMIAVCLLMKKLMHPRGGTKKLINVIMYSGITTIIWGVVYGSFFGYNPNTDWGWKWFPYIISPLNDSITMLIVSIAFGALHLITGLVMNGIKCVKEKDYGTLLSKDLSWTLIMIGIGVYFINSTIGLVLALTGVALIILFGGIHKKSIFGKLAFGVLGLYDATSYLSDLLSYSRVMALVMSSASVAMVMNVLAEMVGGSFVGSIFSAIIYIIGHVFNLVLGLLSAYVHDCRLQYIEFYGKFYEGGGIDFKPLSIKTKYINELKNN